ncbi:MAG: hypothetical protein JRI23_28940, partial [Deltaproteobacteria bacterium]|nr:hypothetical protein [Deltaproteobacteria bacterium]MBW2536155.1 hypothetical protein [Deltaproteobacteria bacterium]
MQTHRSGQRVRRLLPGLLLLGLLLGSIACVPRSKVTAIVAATPADLSGAFARAVRAEALNATSATPYLDAIDQAIEHADDPWAAAVVIAALDALVTRRLADLDASIDQAIAYRSRASLTEIVQRLRESHAAARAVAAERATAAEEADGPSARSEAAALMGAAIAQALHRLALRVGSADGAKRWRQRTGCARS